MPAFQDLTNQKFNRLLVISRASNSKAGRVRWLCKCDCGNFITIQANELINGQVSCGCYKKELGETHKTHGKTNTRLYGVWKGIKQRCLYKRNKEYGRYGGRGITICSDWLDFGIFYNWAIENGYRKGLTIDRIDNNGGYEPSNCRWATPKEQSKNRSDNHIINGKPLVAWAEEKGLSYSCLKHRIRSGWEFERAINTPARQAIRNSDIEPAVKDYVNGIPLREAAKKNHVSFGRLSKILHERNLLRGK